MFYIIIAGVFIADQLTKALIQMFMYRGESIPVLKPFFYLTYIMNPGAAFGFLAHQTYLFITVTAILVAGVLLAYPRLPAGMPLLKYGLGLVVGGALGNLADRLRYGQVVDFLDFRVWPVFNLADTAIVIGAGLLIRELMRDTGKKPA